MEPENERQESTDSTDKKSELSMAVDEAELLIAYLSRNGKTPDSDLLTSMFSIRNLFLKEGVLSSDLESQFWLNYRTLVQMVKPATVSSIIDTCPSDYWCQKFPVRTRRVKRIPLYYGIAVLLLIVFTVSLQTYSMIGADVLHKTFELFNKRNQVRAELREAKWISEADPSSATKVQLFGLEKEEQRLDQEFDANRQHLYDWNGIWRFGAEAKVVFSLYDDYQYQHTLERLLEEQQQLQERLVEASGAKQQKHLKEALAANQQSLHQLNKNRKLDESRNRFFTERLSAVYVVNLLEKYVLPLLFGCLGAFTLVLRTIHESFQQGTFTLKNILDYNIRIVLGGVTGISSGMFFNDSTGLPSGQFGPMLVAFVVGYNVEILFMVMDDLATKLSTKRKSDPTNETKKQCSEVICKKPVNKGQ